MEAIEPLRFDVSGGDLDLPNFEPRMGRGRRNRWDSTYDFLLHQAVEERCQEVSSRSIRREFEDFLESKMEPLERISPLLSDGFSPSMFPTSSALPVIYAADETVVVPNSRHQGLLYVMSNNKNKARNMVDEIESSLTAAPEPYGPLGLEDVSVYRGDNFTLNSLSSINEVTDIEQTEVDPFEEEIHDELRPVSEAFINNIRVSFGDHSPNPEFDILLAISPDSVLSVEVKDYSGTEDQPSEKGIITTPASNAQLVNASLTLSVVKGVDKDVLADYKQQAELRGAVQICEKEQCLSVVKNHMEESMVPESLGMARYPTGFDIEPP